MTINRTGCDLYLKPGYDLKVLKTTTGSHDSIYFEGRGAPVNNYINQFTALLNSEDFIGYDADTFAKKYDSLNVAFENFSRAYFERFPLPEEDMSFLKDLTQIRLLERKVYYAHRVHSDALVDQALKLRKGNLAGKIESKDEMQFAFPKIPFDTAYLAHGIIDYRYILHYYLHEKFVPFADLKLIDSAYGDYPPHVKARWPRQVNTVLQHESYPAGIKEYLIAADLVKWLNSQGITPEIDSLYNEFKLEYGGSSYAAAIQKQYDEYAAVLPGTIAPDFSGRTPEGGLVSLKDFKGKVVYVDVWATWCGPCVEEIPYAKKLHTAFPADKVTFLNVSVYDNVEAWRRMLDKEKDWHGTHIILNRRDSDILSRDYKVGGIPKFFLIDQSGKIVSARASRPSSKNVREEIKSLL